MRSSNVRMWLALVGIGTVAFAAPGCASADLLTESDRQVISQLTEIAPLDSEIDSEVTEVECWKPSDNMIDDNQFRVLCRMHYEEDGNERYRDTICIGDRTADPVTDYCYLWAFYSDMPEFEDQPGHVAV